MDQSKPLKNDSQICDSHEIKNGANKDLEPVEQAQVHASNVELVVGPQMLAEILNKKKMELLRSPEVKDFLMKQQSKLSAKSGYSEHSMKSKRESSDSDICNSQKSDQTSHSSSKR